MIPELDAASLGLNAGTILAINGLTDWVKTQIEGLKLPGYLARFYVAIPFAVAFALCFTQEATLAAAFMSALKYGAAAVVLKNVQRVSIEGK